MIRRHSNLPQIPVIVSTTIYCLCLHLLSTLQDLISPPIKNIRWCHITECLVVAAVVVVVDEVGNRLLQLAGNFIG